MKKILFLLFFICTQFSSAHAQLSEAETLSNQVAALYKEGKLDEAIPVAEKIILLHRNASEKNYQKLASAVANLALLKKQKSELLLKSLPKENNTDKSDSMKVIEQYESDAESLFKEVIDIHEKQLKSASPLLAISLGELAWVKANYFPPRAPGTDYSTRLEDAEDLYAQSVILKEKIFGAAHDTTQATLLEFAEFQLDRLELEKALPLYLRYIKIAEQTKNANNKGLTKSLRALALIQISTDVEKEARETCEKIAKILGQTEKLPEPNLLLSNRLQNGQKMKEALASKRQVFRPIVGALSLGGGAVIDANTERARLYPTREDLTYPESAGPKPPQPVYVKITVDEKGSVIEAVANSKDEKLKARAEKEVLRFKYKPFVYEGTVRKMRGWAVYYDN